MRHFAPSPDAQLKARIAAALANNPRISPSQLAEQTGLTLGAAIAMLERRAA
jgi:DNA-binding MarR family transcriptional regulator